MSTELEIEFITGVAHLCITRIQEFDELTPEFKHNVKVRGNKFIEQLDKLASRVYNGEIKFTMSQRDENGKLHTVHCDEKEEGCSATRSDLIRQILDKKLDEVKEEILNL